MPLLNLPNELLLSVAGVFESGSDINALTQTNRRLHALINQYLYRHNVVYNGSKGLQIALTLKRKETLKDDWFAIEREDLNKYYHPTEPTISDGLPVPVTQDVIALDTTIRLFLENGAVLDYVNDDFQPTALHRAASSRQETVFWLLIRHGSDVNTVDCRYKDAQETTLHFAALGGCPRILRFLVKEKMMDVNARGVQGRTPLHCAASQFNETAIRLLVENGVQIDIRDRRGLTPLHRMIAFLRRVEYKRYFPTVLVLLKLGADIEKAKDDWGWTPLMTAASIGHDALVKSLLELGAQVETRSTDGTTPLHAAIQEGCLPAAEILLENGGNIHNRKVRGELLLYTAVKRQYKHNADVTVRWLLEKGADVCAMSGYGKTVLQHMKDEGHMRFLEDYPQWNNSGGI